MEMKLCCFHLHIIFIDLSHHCHLAKIPWPSVVIYHFHRFLSQRLDSFLGREHRHSLSDRQARFLGRPGGLASKCCRISLDDRGAWTVVRAAWKESPHAPRFWDGGPCGVHACFGGCSAPFPSCCWPPLVCWDW